MEKFAFHADCINWEVSCFITAIILLGLSIFKYFTEYKKSYSNLFTFLYMNEDKYLNILNVYLSMTIFYYILRIICTIIYGFQSA